MASYGYDWCITKILIESILVLTKYNIFRKQDGRTIATNEERQNAHGKK